MNALFAASLFDSPWLVAIFIIVGALSNWLMKRREEQKQKREREAMGEVVEKNEEEINLEETFRRLLGETPPQPPAPPRIPRAAPGERPPVQVWGQERQPPVQTWTASVGEMVEDEDGYQTLTPGLQPALEQVGEKIAEQQELAAKRLLQAREQAGQPAPVMRRPRGRRVRGTSPWRKRQTARQAFVASLVFAPPKGLEP